MLCELVRTTTPDGMKLDGALHAANSPPHANVDLAIGLHGVGSSFYSSSVIENLLQPLNSLGIPLLRVNTRGHDNVCTASTSSGRKWQGAAFEIVDECRYDVLGWLDWATKNNYRRVLLVGHSLGAIKALYAAAHESLPSVIGIVAVSPPRLSYSRFRQGFDNDKFFEAMATAEGLFQQRRPESLFQAKFPFPLFITGSGYVDKYGPRERYNILKFVGRVPHPMLFTYGSVELKHGAAFNGVVEQLSALAESPTRMQVTTVADADHLYSGKHAALGGVVAEWIKSACS